MTTVEGTVGSSASMAATESLNGSSSEGWGRRSYLGGSDSFSRRATVLRLICRRLAMTAWDRPVR